MMSGERTRTYDIGSLSALFNELDGYYNLPNRDLAGLLVDLDLLQEQNRMDAQTVASYVKWSFTASFLQLVNAWQWFLSGVLLARQSYMPSQVMQMYYYSIFFSYGAFLSAQLKGHYTLRVETTDNGDVKKTRKEVWTGEHGNQPHICVGNRGRGGEHEIRAKWFYKVFGSWDLKDHHPDVLAFEDDRSFLVGFRNMLTYSLADVAEELFYHDPDFCPAPPANEVLLRLWRRNKDWVECFPEEFWALEHIKVVVDLHVKLLEQYGKISPYTDAQVVLAGNLYRHHQKTRMTDLLEEAMNPIFTHMGIGDE
jgi:hypothetical protein